MKNLLTVIIGIIVIGSIECYAQSSFSLSGRITDKNSSEPIVGATITIDAKGLWAISDNDGYYKIRNIGKSNITAQISFLGYQSQTIELKLVAGENVHNVALSEKNLTLEEVVVTAQRRTENQSSSYVMHRKMIKYKI